MSLLLHAACGSAVADKSQLSVERFHEQDAAYQRSVLPPGTKRVAIEAGRSEPWKMLLGDGALAIGIDRFGASAPDKVLGEKFGFTVDQVTAKIEAFIRG